MSYPGLLVILRYWEWKSIEFGKELVKTSEREWREVICTGRA